MPTAENAILYYEAGQDLVPMAALADAGDHKTFESPDPIWSDRAGYAPNVKPNGLATGGAVSPAASGANDAVDITALTCYLAGVLTSVSAAADKALTRSSGVSGDYIINSITITSAGAIAVVAGAEGNDFSAIRGAAGGPPWIPTDSIEIAQVKMSSDVAAPITADEIFQVVGAHLERYDYPTWKVKKVNVQNQVIGNAGIEFASALPLIHSDDSGTTTAGKKVYAEYYEPLFAEVPKSAGFVPAETSHTTNSTPIYGGTLGAKSSSLGQGSFTAYPNDGISDGLIGLKNEKLWFKYKPNRLEDPYILMNGYLGISRTFPAGDSIAASCTVSVEEAAVEVVS